MANFLAGLVVLGLGALLDRLWLWALAADAASQRAEAARGEIAACRRRAEEQMRRTTHHRRPSAPDEGGSP